MLLNVLHTSAVHTLLSLQSASTLHCWLGLQPGIGANKHMPLPTLHKSLVHTLLSLQSVFTVQSGVGLQFAKFWYTQTPL